MPSNSTTPTAHLAFDVMLHEPAQFDRAAKVNEAPGLSPVAHNALHPEPINPTPSDIIIDPVRTIPIHSAHARPVPIDHTPMLPKPTDSAPTSSLNPIPGDATIDPVHSAFVHPVPRNSTAILSVHPDFIPIHTALGNPVLADPIPVDPDPILPKPAPVNFIHVKPEPIVPVDPDPVNPSPITMDDCIPAAHTHVTITYLIPADSVLTDSNPVTGADMVDITPTKPVHVDPMSDTLITLLISQALTHAHPFCFNFFNF
jgi:hypothetical protein